MTSELVVDVQPSEISIALLENGRLAEVNKETREQTYAVGNIYYGRVKKIMPGLNAAFVDVGYGKDAFLHYLDLGSNFETLYRYTKQAVSDRKRTPVMNKAKIQPELGKSGSITDVLSVGQKLLVQVTKEPISTKGPRLSAEISIAGRYLVLIPFAEKVSVSAKISSEAERVRLRKLVQSIKPKGFGVIIRTVAEDKKVAELDNELKILVKRWEDVVAKLQKSQAVSLISEEIGRTIGIIRDIFNPTFQHIHVNDKAVFAEVKDYVELIAPDRKNIVKLYTGELPIFDNFAITKQMKTGLGRTVSFKNGAYLIIEHTEALHVIDVNSGNRSKSDDQETNAYEVNLAAADEIAHQLRLRDMGGIIVVDFIDMAKAEHKQGLYDHMREIMENDRAKHNILQLSKFGLMQITRQRVRPAVDMDVTETCPTCLGTHKVQPTILFVDELENKIRQLVENSGKCNLTLYVHPYVEAYITKGWLKSIIRRWRQKYGRIRVIPSQKLGFLQWEFYDNKGNKLDLKKESAEN